MEWINFNKLCMLIKMEIKRIFSKLSNVLLLIVILAIFVNMFIFLFSENTMKFDSTIVLAVEDESIEVNTLIGNVVNNKLKNIINFERVTLDEGLKLLEKNKAIAMIYVKEDTGDKLDRCQKAGIDLYVTDKSNIVVKFLIEYLDSLVEVLNEGQRGAMIYWDIMKEDGFTYEQRYNKLNEIAISYVSNFLARSSIYEDTEGLDKYSGSIIDYYFYSVVIILGLMLAIFYSSSIEDDYKTKKIQRLSGCTGSWIEIYLAKIIIGAIYVLLVNGILITAYLKFTDGLETGRLIKTLAICFIYSFVINLLILAINTIDISRIVKMIGACSLGGVLLITSGVIVPLTSMPNIIRMTSDLNILKLIHSLFLGRAVKIHMIIVMVVYIVCCIFVISKSHKKRMCTYD